MAGVGGSEEERMADMLDRLNLTKDEGEVAAFSDDEGGDEASGAECKLLGKVLSPATLHIPTIRSAMKSAWGNPCGLKLRSVGDKAENLFIIDFGGTA